MLGINDHVSRIAAYAGNTLQVSGDDGVSARPNTIAGSWKRCMDRYGFDPAVSRKVSVLTEGELKVHREPVDKILHFSGEEIDQVFLAVSAIGFSFSIANAAGLMIAERSTRNGRYYSDVERPGTLWTEAAAGTNGVGTCIVERRPAAIFQNDHFFYDFAALSCATAPVFDANAELMGVVNLSIKNPDLPADTFHLVYALTLRLADRLHERLFRHDFRRSTILKFAVGEKTPGLIAVDADYGIVGMNHTVRDLVKDQGRSAKQRSLWSVFDRSDHIPNLAKSAEESLRLRFAGTETTVSIAATAPTEPLPNARRFPSAPVVKHAPNYPSSPPTLDECAGSDERMLASIRLVRRLANSSLPFLLLGETGVGKDTLARAIHAESDRRAGPFIAFNCAAIPETLIDSELFGYGGGAFTGARREGNSGRVVEADGGTLFLDEIGDMPPALQTRLLRIIESNEVTPLGSGKARQVDIRIVAATNQDLGRRIADGLFRKDLYFRLAGAAILISPLRERSDLPDLIARILERVRGDDRVTLDPGALDRLLAYDWPGNIRELRHVLHRAAQICDNGLITKADLMLYGDTLLGASFPAAPDMPIPEGPSSADAMADFASDTVRGATAMAERTLIIETLKRCSGDIKRSAEALNVSRATLYRKLRRYSIQT